MARCQFIYLRTRDNHIEGGQCDEEATHSYHTLCLNHRYAWRQRRIHRERLQSESESGYDIPNPSITSGGDPDSDQGFPRQCSDDEIQEWVDEARAKTDPMKCWRRGCVICGRNTVDGDMVGITVGDLIKLKELLKDLLPGLEQSVPAGVFEYKGVLSAINGLPFDQNGLLTSEELIHGAPVVAKGCMACYKAIQNGTIPDHALGNGLWTGIDAGTPLSDLTWIEEKLIARVHVSVQIQKCRSFRAAVADGFHPQRQIKGHILTYPMEPGTVLRQLPLSPNRLIGLIKVVFLSRNPVQRSTIDRFRFYLVRREKVETALRWLIRNNPYYHDVLVDEVAMQQLPESGIPEEVYAQLGVVNHRREDACGHSRYDAPDDGTLSQPFHRCSSCLFDIESDILISETDESDDDDDKDQEDDDEDEEGRMDTEGFVPPSGRHTGHRHFMCAVY